MRKVLLFSLLLIAGMVGAELLPSLVPAERLDAVRTVISWITVASLGFLMIHVGAEFELDKSRWRQYVADGAIATTAAVLPWLFCVLWFLLFLLPEGSIGRLDAWKETLLAGMFAAPTSAGILFAMLAAAGLSSSWLFRKARLLAIFDDLATVLLLIPLKALVVGLHWQLGVVMVLMALLCVVGWRRLHSIALPTRWPWVVGYAVAIAFVSEVVYHWSKTIDPIVPIHLEVLLPAFVLGCVLKLPAGHGHQGEGAADTSKATEERVATFNSALFMVLVGLSMPPIRASLKDLPFGDLALQVLAITLVSNLGKMFPLFCYRREVRWRQRLALCIGMWPRGEVGAGILVLTLSYGIGGAMVSVATLSLALNLLLTGAFIWMAKRLLHADSTPLAET